MSKGQDGENGWPVHVVHERRLIGIFEYRGDFEVEVKELAAFDRTRCVFQVE